MNKSFSLPSRDRSQLPNFPPQYRFFPKLMVAVFFMSFGIISPAAAGGYRFKNISPSAFSNCIRNYSGGGGYSEYSGGDQGTANIRVNGGMWLATLSYSYNSQTSRAWRKFLTLSLMSDI